MRELEIHREVNRREARRAQGLNPHSPHLLASHAATAGYEAAILALPVNVDDREPMQDASGNFYFMFDFSSFDGADPWA